ncbi:hypothetical protein [Streptomyces sp. NPDC002463]|uniref:hypothetical protein n=1 Tax=Streptomyces sp. NPDC002463 TaxID=3364645 RepID=UPI0036BFF595
MTGIAQDIGSVIDKTLATRTELSRTRGGDPPGSGLEYLSRGRPPVEHRRQLGHRRQVDVRQELLPRSRVRQSMVEPVHRPRPSDRSCRCQRTPPRTARSGTPPVPAASGDGIPTDV